MKSADPPPTIDWEDAKRRIAQLEVLLSKGDVYTPEASDAILYARAQILAAVIEEPADSSDAIEVMIVGLAGESYALETAVVREVIRPTTLALLPGTAKYVAGVMNLRGRPLLIVDGRQLLGLTTAKLTDSARVVVVGVDQDEFGLLTESSEEVTSLKASQISEAPKSLPLLTRRFVRGVTHDAMIVLDTQSLLDDPRLWIDEQED